jgi:hypothetical protein
MLLYFRFWDGFLHVPLNSRELYLRTVLRAGILGRLIVGRKLLDARTPCQQDQKTALRGTPVSNRISWSSPLNT